MIPSLPGHGFSGKPTETGLGPHPHRPRLGRADAAPRVHAVRGPGRRLGERGHGADGAADAPGTARHPHQHAGDGSARRLARRSRPAARRPPASRPTSRRRTTQLAHFYKTGLGYARRWRTARRRCTRIADSPVGLAAWMLDHDARSYELIARVFDGKPEGLTRDDVLDNVTLYWLTNTAVSSARLYWESKLAFFDVKGVDIPVGVSVFPDELYPAPRSWAERAYPKLIHYNRLAKGGHFAAWEQPQRSRRRSGRRSARCADRGGRAARRGPPPGLDGATAWLNTAPLTLEGLRGKVVLVDFWTYTCINWLRTVPYLRAWAAKYATTAWSSSASTHRSSRSSTTSRSVRSRGAGRRVPGRGRQRLRGLARVRQPVLAGPVPRRRRRAHPSSPLRRGGYEQSERVIQRLLARRAATTSARPGVGRAGRRRARRRLGHAGIAGELRRLRAGHRLRVTRWPRTRPPPPTRAVGLRLNNWALSATGRWESRSPP